MLADNGPDFEGYSDAEAVRLIGRPRQVLAVSQDPRKALVELEAVLESDLADADAAR